MITKSSNIYIPSDKVEEKFIKNIWRIDEFHLRETKETILPKGTVEIIFNLSDKIIYLNSAFNNMVNLPSCFVNGINSKPFNLIKSGPQLFLGIQLTAIGLKGLFNVSVKDFMDNVVDGSQVCRSLYILCDKLFSKKTFDEQVEIIRKWLWNKISASKHYKTINRFHNIFYSQNSKNLSVAELSNKNLMTDRHLRRIAVEWLGMNTESFLLYNKYLSSLQLLHNSNKTLTEIGLECGYFDQSHFIREFKSYTELTPGEYKAFNSTLPGHIFS
ncbi:MAG: helix-turn-helix transcriptional regulator [Bacteroidetes bacterium]|nr:helix-turn-helix transcriptional regulator [Bacteroidota bacterium]